jgi:hypothetical protein
MVPTRQTPVLAIPPIGAPESLARLSLKGLRTATRAQRAPLRLILQGFARP